VPAHTSAYRRSGSVAVPLFAGHHPSTSIVVNTRLLTTTSRSTNTGFGAIVPQYVTRALLGALP
jgi:hypothetical protein